MRMKQITIMDLALLVFLGACKQTIPDGTVAAPLAATQASLSPTCPSVSFDGFLKAFINSVEVQKSFTSTPLESQAMDAAAEPEPALITKMLTVSEMQLPLIPGEQEQISQGLKMRQSVLENRDIKVTLEKEDTDYQVSFYFRENHCWQLYRVRNESL